MTNEFRILQRFTLRNISHHLPRFQPFIFHSCECESDNFKEVKRKNGRISFETYFMKGPYPQNILVLSTAPPKFVNYFETHVISHFMWKVAYNTAILTPWGALQRRRLICSCGHSQSRNLWWKTPILSRSNRPSRLPLLSEYLCRQEKGYSLTVNNADDFMPQILTTATLTDSVENLTRKRTKRLFNIITWAIWTEKKAQCVS